MKTMNLKTMKKFPVCLNFRHLSLLTILSLLSVSVSAEDMNHIFRKPAAVEEEVLTVPLDNDSFSVESVFAEDDAGVMRGMKESLSGWEKTEEYAHTWGLESTGLYTTPDTAQKRKFISSKILRYADKRLSGEMKKADEGSTLHKMSKVEKQLRPNASVPVNKYISVKFKARVLQGKAIVEVKNPWFECNATVSANGKAKVITRKEFKDLGLASGAEYTVNDSQFVAYVDQQVTNNIKARISSTSVPDNDADARVEMTASFPFNL